MDRIYRIAWKGEARYAVERDGVLSLVRGDIFGRYDAAEQVAAGSGASFGVRCGCKHRTSSCSGCGQMISHDPGAEAPGLHLVWRSRPGFVKLRSRWRSRLSCPEPVEGRLDAG
jgi:hypothetical protein